MNLLWISLMVSLVAAPGGKADPVFGIAARLQKSYESIRSVEAEFAQVYRSRRFGEKKASGSVIIAKPGKMRWDYVSPKGKVIVANGRELTLYDPEDQQALVTPQPKDGSLPVGMSFLWGKGNLSDSFHLTITKDETRKGKRFVTLHCLPKERIPNVTEIYLTLRITNPMVIVSSRIVDALGGENEIKFSNLKINGKYAPKRFDFKPPAGTPIVSMDGLREIR